MAFLLVALLQTNKLTSLCPSFFICKMLMVIGTFFMKWSKGLNKLVHMKSVLKAINPEYSLEGLMLKLKLQYFGHLMRRADSSEKTLMLGKIEGRRRSG